MAIRSERSSIPLLPPPVRLWQLGMSQKTIYGPSNIALFAGTAPDKCCFFLSVDP
jgi:hypothetical protein